MPLYRQLYVTLLNDINAGKWKYGERLPSERDLAEAYRVSRITTRQAVEALVKAGVVYREQGRGTFVANLNSGQFSFNSFTTDTLARGKTPSTRMIHFECKQASAEIARQLKCKEGDNYFDVARVRLADNIPVAIQTHHIVANHCPNLNAEEMEHLSLFDVLRNTYGIVPAWTEPVIRLSYATAFEKEHLGVEISDPLVLVEATTYTEIFELIEWVATLYRSDGLELFLGRQRIDGKL